MKTKNTPHKNFSFENGFAIQNKEYAGLNSFHILPNFLFTNIVYVNLCSLCVSDVIPFLKLIAVDHSLNLSRANDFKKAKYILLNSINNN